MTERYYPKRMYFDLDTARFGNDEALVTLYTKSWTDADNWEWETMTDTERTEYAKFVQDENQDNIMPCEWMRMSRTSEAPVVQAEYLILEVFDFERLKYLMKKGYKFRTGQEHIEHDAIYNRMLSYSPLWNQCSWQSQQIALLDKWIADLSVPVQNGALS